MQEAEWVMRQETPHLLTHSGLIPLRLGEGHISLLATVWDSHDFRLEDHGAVKVQCYPVDVNISNAITIQWLIFLSSY